MGPDIFLCRLKERQFANKTPIYICILPKYLNETPRYFIAHCCIIYTFVDPVEGISFFEVVSPALSGDNSQTSFI